MADSSTVMMTGNTNMTTCLAEEVEAAAAASHAASCRLFHASVDSRSVMLWLERARMWCVGLIKQ